MRFRFSSYPVDYYRWYEFKRWLEIVRFITVRYEQIVPERARDTVVNQFSRSFA